MRGEQKGRDMKGREKQKERGDIKGERDSESERRKGWGKKMLKG